MSTQTHGKRTKRTTWRDVEAAIADYRSAVMGFVMGSHDHPEIVRMESRLERTIRAY